MNEQLPMALALALTRVMLDAARTGDWEQVVALEAERQPLAMQPVAGDADSVRQLGELLALDCEVRALVTQARETAGAQWQAGQDRARAIAAYGG
ncbi:flagellar protein FliT [Frateuria terrea]|uniref:Flagellar protein FliT n=1 Tax=Frateuria terrea TaxID=529704 RepID=A0A1H6W242_9GAMM|nr:flagellar protein FliT [Frateuria terrea]SEJ08147.1 protein FliT [Frateuria terrea]SFP69161.1 protein FliT [Frateuria terrea]